MIEEIDEKGRILESVRKRLPTKGLDVLPLRVLDEEVRKEGDWWIVPIQANSIPKRRYMYYEVLAEMEEDLEMRDQLDIVLVPVDPD